MGGQGFDSGQFFVGEGGLLESGDAVVELIEL
jgi:hypothetical protein